MQSRASRPRLLTGGPWIVAALAAFSVLFFVPGRAQAQYFGRNKVQYEDFDWQVLKTQHFDIHFYPAEKNIGDIARMAERWYERYARTFQHEFEQRKPIIMYADHADFQQTNTLQGTLGEGTGGVTESLKNRVILPQTGSYGDTDHVLGHELVHAFQYNIAQSSRGGGMQGMNGLPGWLVEGMAEYMSKGRDDPLTTMWLRDALRRDEFPTIAQMTKGTRFFPYRFGQALWAYIGGTYSDDAVVQLYRRSLRIGFEPAIDQILGVKADSLSAEWRRKVEQDYGPLMEGKKAPEDVGSLLLGPENAGEQYNISPSLSPDGRYIAFLSEKDLFSIDMFLADAKTGKIIRKLSSSSTDPHYDAMRYVESSGTFSPDGQYFAYVVFADGDNELVIVKTDSGDLWRQVKPIDHASLNHPAWSPDGRYIAFTGIVGGVSDLYLYDVQENKTVQLNNDKYADYQPEWSPDGKTIAFASDRGPETDFQKLTFSRFQIALMDVDTRRIRTLNLLGDVGHMEPEFSPDGKQIYFLSDYDGFRDIYRADLASGQVERITNIATGVSGITLESPALSVASQTGTLAFSVFNNFSFQIHTLPANPPGVPVNAVAELPARKLPPVAPDRFSRVSEYLSDPLLGLEPLDSIEVAPVKDYQPHLSLDYVGQPSIGVGTDAFGNYIGGGAAAYFSDMLGNDILGVSLQAQGTFKDIGGQAFYADMGHRWNWGVGAGRIPYVNLYQTLDTDPQTGQNFVGQIRQRIYVTSASGQVSYPFSTTRRFEASLGVTRYSSNVEEDRYYLDEFFRCCTDHQRVNLPQYEFAPLNLVQASAALVSDDASWGFTSPVRGGRSRFEVDGTTGTLDFITGIADWRRYFSPTTNLTFAVRALHYGRYGNVTPGDVTNPNSAQNNLIQPLFLGYETLVRGYDWNSFSAAECAASAADAGGVGGGCPTLARLYGNKIGVASAEIRIPLLGVDRYGLINFPFLPTELSLFTDAGVAWDANIQGVSDQVQWKFSRSSSERVPVFSSGISARFNVLGFMVLEAYYAYPWQRPDKGWLWGFQIAPGW